jgi:hypothetical protein
MAFQTLVNRKLINFQEAEKLFGAQTAIVVVVNLQRIWM